MLRFSCSLPCFKLHKEEICTKTASSKAPEHTPISDITAQYRLETSSKSIVETEDMVAVDKLHRLGESSELGDLLSNPHLQQMMRHLNATTKAPRDIEAAMHEPIFHEFADKCLEIVESEETVAG